MRYINKTSKKVIISALIACIFSFSGSEILSNADTAGKMKIVGDSEVKYQSIDNLSDSGYGYVSYSSKKRTGFYGSEGNWSFYENGVQKRGWIKYKGINYYIKDDYTLPQSTWVEIDGYSYYFDRNGIMVKDQKVRLGGKVYQFDSKGHSIKPDNKTDFRVTDSQEKLYNLGEDILDAARDRQKTGVFYESGKWISYKRGNVVSSKSSESDDIEDISGNSVKSASASKSSSTSKSADLKNASKLVSIAESKLGSPYAWGSSGPNSFDCSGLMLYVFNEIGVSLPRSSSEQSKEGTYVSRSDLKAGDLIFWGSPVHHVGLYIGNGQYIHAPYPGASVEKKSLDTYTTARRVLK